MSHIKIKPVDKVFHMAASGAERMLSHLGGGAYGEAMNKKVPEDTMKKWRKSPVGRMRNTVRRAAGKEPL